MSFTVMQKELIFHVAVRSKIREIECPNAFHAQGQSFAEHDDDGSVMVTTKTGTIKCRNAHDKRAVEEDSSKWDLASF